MRRIALLTLAFGILLPILSVAPAHAQATRTWISGVGDDANPCSRTAPCKTFAGAISKTAASGEIDCLDPGGFGAVTITKAITLNCGQTLGSILVSGTNGIVISAGTSDIVVLRGLQLQGLGPTGASAGLVGVKINSAASVSIENCVITQFGQQGIFDTRTGGGTRLFVKDTIVSHNAGSGIAIGAGAVNNAEIDNTQSIRNLFGVSTATGNNVMIRRSIFSGNSTAGLESDAGAQLNVNDSTISNNGIGLQTGGVMRVSNSDVAFNTTAVSGSVITWGNNRFSANGSPGTALQPAGAASSDIGQQ